MTQEEATNWALNKIESAMQPKSFEDLRRANKLAKDELKFLADHIGAYSQERIAAIVREIAEEIL